MGCFAQAFFRKGVACVSGRASAFTNGAMLSDAPDAMFEIWIDDIATEVGGCLPKRVDPSRKYGGLEYDLRDPLVLNWSYCW